MVTASGEKVGSAQKGQNFANDGNSAAQRLQRRVGVIDMKTADAG